MSKLPAADAAAADVGVARLVADSLRFHWFEGGVPVIPAGYSTGWRVMPMGVVAVLLAGEGVVEIEDQPPRAGGAGVASCIPAGVLHRITHPVG
ncbi:MAG: hypothetical protein H0X45_11575, partial [Planctomycetes bacterium]|nr:hypothetical protein [Planctomycetota bacterium]